MEKNKTRRYFKYAIGEIILVVIGILIALQINNWNQGKIAREYELNILSELYTSLTADYDYISNHSLSRNRKTSKAVHYFYDLIKGQDRPIDSLRFHFNWLNQGLFFQINSGPYESLKSAGVDKISNDSLRNQIVNYYDFKVPRINKLITWGQRNTETGAKLKSEITDSFKAEVINDNVRIFRPTPDLTIIRNPKFLELLDLAEFRSNWTEDHFNELIRSLIPLKKHIQSELMK